MALYKLWLELGVREPEVVEALGLARRIAEHLADPQAVLEDVQRLVVLFERAVHPSADLFLATFSAHADGGARSKCGRG